MSISKEIPITIFEICGSELKKMYGDFGFRLIGEGWSDMNYNYEYTKCKAGEEKVKPVYSKKKVAETMENIKNSMKGK